MPVSTLKVAVLRGGPSDEFEVSLKTGEHVLSILRSLEGYEPEDIFISKDGVWHKRGIPVEPHEALLHADVAWNALHGAYGEDGRVQQILERYKIPYTGSGILPSAMAMQKQMAKDIYKKAGLLTPDGLLIEEGDDLDAKLGLIFRSYVLPVIVKPAGSGSSVGLKVAHTLGELKEAVTEAVGKFKKVLVEQLVKGKEATCAVIDDVRGERTYALIPIEIVPAKGLFDYEAKYSGKSRELCPGTFTTEENKKIEALAKKAHQALGMRHYSRSDFIVTPRNVYILETNSLPGFTKESLLPKALKATGWRNEDFVEHVIKLARG